MLFFLGGGNRMNSCMVCKKHVSNPPLSMCTPIPLLGILQSTNGWVAHSDCLFQINTTSL